MSRIYRLLQQVERPLFLHVNVRWNRAALDRLFHALSIVGGATFSLSVTILLGWLAPEPWGVVAWQAFAAIVVSHVPVAIAKRSMPRLRPYQAFPGIRTNGKPLKDPSFPSGHTTAAFALLTPWMLTEPLLVPVLLPIALGVALSRVYFGLHYPSDTAAGALIGFLTGLLMTAWI